eukprot:6641535-Pyramimonas_sp.AAC.1
MQRHPPPAAGDPRTSVLATGFGERPGDVDPVRGELLGTVDVDQHWGWRAWAPGWKSLEASPASVAT